MIYCFITINDSNCYPQGIHILPYRIEIYYKYYHSCNFKYTVNQMLSDNVALFTKLLMPIDRHMQSFEGHEGSKIT